MVLVELRCYAYWFRKCLTAQIIRQHYDCKHAKGCFIVSFNDWRYCENRSKSCKFEKNIFWTLGFVHLNLKYPDWLNSFKESIQRYHFVIGNNNIRIYCRDSTTNAIFNSQILPLVFAFLLSDLKIMKKMKTKWKTYFFIQYISPHFWDSFIDFQIEMQKLILLFCLKAFNHLNV